jgi:thioredoxin 1
MIFGKTTPIPETSGKVYKVATASEFDALLKSTRYVVVDFYADWCPPCRAIAPIFSKLADETSVEGGLAFAKVNVDHVNDVAGRYSVSAMPSFLFFEGGKPTLVSVPNIKKGASVVLADNGSVERIRGADPMALTSVVLSLSSKVKGVTTTPATDSDKKAVSE